MQSCLPEIDLWWTKVRTVEIRLEYTTPFADRYQPLIEGKRADQGNAELHREHHRRENVPKMIVGHLWQRDGYRV